MKTLALSLISALAFAQAPQYPVLPGGGGGGAVSSVFGRTGGVVAAGGDYTAAQVTGAEATANKDVANGYAGLNSSGFLKLAEQNATIYSPAGAPRYNVLSTDRGKILRGDNLGTIGLIAVATAGSGFYFSIINNSSSSILLQANADAATVNGVAVSFFPPILPNQSFTLICDGSNWFTQGYYYPILAATSSTSGTAGIANGANIGQQDLPLLGSTAYGTSTVGRFIAQTAAKTVLTMTTTVATDETYLVSANVNVTTATAHSFTVTATYTDETNTSRTLTLPFVALAGTTLTTITNVTGAGPYEGVPVHIRCKANTTITIASVGTFTTVTYNIEAHIRHLQ